MKLGIFLSLLNGWWIAVLLLLLAHPATSSCASQFRVENLPGSPPFPHSWAGRLPVPGTEEGNSLFFWLFDAEDIVHDDNFIIWFAGGPGCSSLVGLTSGNGPISFVGNTTNLTQNPYSWTKLGHVLYVDQPVGTGFSTASDPYPVDSNDRLTSDFYNWLKSFFVHFPHLRSKRIHLIGESYAGIYIPYFGLEIMKNYDSLPLDIQSLTMGDGTWANGAALTSVGIGSYLRSQKEILGIPGDILAAFAQADHECGFSAIMAESSTFPAHQTLHVPGNPEGMNTKRHFGLENQNELVKLFAKSEHPSSLQGRDMVAALSGACDISPTTPEQVLHSIMNNSCYGSCATFSTASDYINAAKSRPCFDTYNINATCDTPDPNTLASIYFSRSDVQAALNIPPPPNTTTPYEACSKGILAKIFPTAPTPPAYSAIPNLVNRHQIPMHFFQGEYDMLVNHIGTELSLQNLTWNGAQGFSRRPGRKFYADNAAPPDIFPLSSDIGSGSRIFNATHFQEKHQSGTWISERGITYHLFRGAGHSVFVDKPKEMFSYVRDVVVGL